MALLTPVAKAFCSDKGLDNCVLGQQVFGGHGFIREWGAEQLVRDVRISQIYEGTNGIQSLDLMGRKVAFSGGRLLDPFVEDVEDFIHSAEGNEKLTPMVNVLQSSLNQLQEATQWVLEHSKENPNEIGSASVPYLHLMGHVGYAYVWGLMAAKALEKDPQLGDAFYSAKFKTAQFYFGRIMPITDSLLAEIKSGAELLYLHSEDAF